MHHGAPRLCWFGVLDFCGYIGFRATGHYVGFTVQGFMVHGLRVQGFQGSRVKGSRVPDFVGLGFSIFAVIWGLGLLVP